MVHVATQVIASIPSPGSNSIELGPLSLRAYGLLIAIGVVAAVWLTQRRWAAKGHDPEQITTMAMWAVPFGVVGARIYHVITDNERFRGNWAEAFEIWSGGLGIWGAIAGGAVGAMIAARRNDMPMAELADAVAPGLLVAQAIGRLGNWFNQELFGRPSDLPWALEIDPEHRPAEYLDVETFHPTFLYEMIWNLAVAAFLIFVVPRILPRLRDGGVFALYVVGYTFGRLWIELVRIDPASEVLGQRVNVWVSLLVMAGGLVAFWRLRGGRAEVEPDPEPAEPTA
ncbi:MAG: prolipoprotein diacylglyceryl transferase [Actinomycetota bacterium]